MFNFEFLFSGYLSLLVLRPRLRMNFVKKKQIYFFQTHGDSFQVYSYVDAFLYTGSVKLSPKSKNKRAKLWLQILLGYFFPLPLTVKAKMNKHLHRLLTNVLICLCCCNKILQDRNSFSYNSEGWEKSKHQHIRFLVDVFLVVVQMAVFLLCSHVAFSWGCKWRES